MSMRSTLLVAAGLILLMAMTLIFFGKDSEDDLLLAPVASMVDEENESIEDAREAFWDQDLAKAERVYRILTNTDDADIDAWGELGNIYYMQARWKEAANAYTEVALRLIDKKDMQQAAFFHYLVSQMDQEQSARINERLQNLKTKQENNS